MDLAHRNLLIDVIPKLLPALIDLTAVLQNIGHGDVLTRVPQPAPYRTTVSLVVHAAAEERWAQELNASLLQQAPKVPELKLVEAALAKQTLIPTAAKPIDEALLAGDRPFVNRIKLRNALLRLIDPAGDSVLLVEGMPKTGKSFTYYLVDHVATRHGFFVHQFRMAQAPPPRQLAEDIVNRLLGDPATLSEQGLESAERWAEKLADDIFKLMLTMAVPRFFVFDDFPDVTLPPGTLSLISRLATYADQELRGKLRVVLMRFPGELATEIMDVAATETVEGFQPTDMTATLMQIATARKWDITETTAKAKIDEFERQQPRTLRERFLFLRTMVLGLMAAASSANGAPDTNPMGTQQ
jgi:hypothetical protein